MARISLMLLLFVAACAGAQVPMHNGYKGKKPAPWKKAKSLKFDDKMEAKAEGSLNYGQYKRAVWYVADLPQPGELDLHLEITPPGDAVNDEFDLGFEIMDSGYRTIAKADSEEADAGDLTKQKALRDLEPGKYYVHLYLQGRLDTADYLLKAAFKPSTSVGKSDFPAQVAFAPALPMVPLTDDTPPGKIKPAVAPAPPKGPKQPKPPKQPDAPKAEPVKASILGMKVVSGGTEITVSRGTSNGAAVGMKVSVPGVPGTFDLGACGDRTCTAIVKATPDQMKGAGAVVLTP